eukprot:s1191_g7.t1
MHSKFARICQLLNFPPMLSLCSDLRELLVEPCFSDDSDDEWDNILIDSRRRQTSLNAFAYDPETDDYEMTTTCPECPEVVELEEKQLIMKQIMSLQNRIAQGGSQVILDHYVKVKEDMMLKLCMTSSDGKQDLSSFSRISTCDTDLTPPALIELEECVTLGSFEAALPRAMKQRTQRNQMSGWQALRMRQSSAFESSLKTFGETREVQLRAHAFNY